MITPYQIIDAVMARSLYDDAAWSHPLLPGSSWIISRNIPVLWSRLVTDAPTPYILLGLSDKQVDELAKRMAQSCAAWSGRLVLAANRKSIGLILATILCAVLVGGLAAWLTFGMPIHPVCATIQGGGRICGAWTVPPPAAPQ